MGAGGGGGSDPPHAPKISVITKAGKAKSLILIARPMFKMVLVYNSPGPDKMLNYSQSTT